MDNCENFSQKVSSQPRSKTVNLRRKAKNGVRENFLYFLRIMWYTYALIRANGTCVVSSALTTGTCACYNIGATGTQNVMQQVPSTLCAPSSRYLENRYFFSSTSPSETTCTHGTHILEYLVQIKAWYLCSCGTITIPEGTCGNNIDSI